MGKEKLMPGECIMPEEGQPICNEDGELVRKSLDNVNEEPEMDIENKSPTIGDRFATIWNKTP